MVWQLFAFLAALFSSLDGVFSKKALRDLDEYMMAGAFRFFALPFLLPVLLFTGIPEIGSQFWPALIGGAGVSVIAMILIMKSLKHFDLSLVTPMIAFTPLFLLLTSPIINNEFPAPLGIVGVVTIVAGSYLLHIREMKGGLLGPLKAILKNKGSRMMFIAAFLWSITSNLDKIGIQNSSPFFWPVAMGLMTSLAMIPIIFWKSKTPLIKIPTNLKNLVSIGLFSSLTMIFQMLALSLTFVAYVISIKRTSAIMSVIWGKLFFKEKGIRERLIGAVIMVLGVVLITLS